jgi:hypothetical protein
MRIKSHEITIVSPMRFQQHHEAFCCLPLDKMLTEDLFLDVRSLLRVGDFVNLCEYNSRDEAAPDRKLLAVAAIRITEIGEYCCKYEVMSLNDFEKNDQKPEPAKTKAGQKKVAA